ncbi:MAG: DoxX family protein [bacterium]|nr:DoxX family protein [bacterium]MDT8396288.1 MauE/DoxX family redox-associated membrane protein [bacterium]
MSLLNWTYRLVRWAIGGLFLYAGLLKLADPDTFAVLIDAYGIVPESLLMPVAVALPALEVFAGIGLILDIEGSLSIIAGLLLFFIVLLRCGIWMGLDIECGCFGPGDPEAEAFHGLWQAIYRDLAMLCGVALLYGQRRFKRVETVRARAIINAPRAGRPNQ